MKTFNISLMALMAAQPALAQDIALDEIVITANRTETMMANTGVSVDVLGGADLARANTVSVAAALDTLPGVAVTAQGPFGSAANIRIRGADQRYISVLIDGIKVGDPASTQTAFNAGSLTTGDVGRIEVLRGSQSALWGGSAVGGVVNISSRKPTEQGLHHEATAEAGAFGTKNMRYTLLNKQGNFESSLTFSHLETDGFSAATAGTEADGARSTRLSATLRYRASQALTFGASVFAQDSMQEYDGYDAFFAPADADNVQDRSEFGARLFGELSTGNTDHVFDITSYKIDRTFDDAGFVTQYSGDRLGLGWVATTNLSQAMTLVYGLDAMRETALYSNLPGGLADTTIAGAFVEGLWTASDRLDISATLRQDQHSAFGGFATGRLALAYRPAAATTLRAAVATGFRAPSIDELYGDYSAFFFVGNPDLTPEQSVSYELGIEHEFTGGAVISATAFRLDIDNLIAATADFSTLENIAGTSTRQGLELAGSLPIGAFDLGLAYTYTDARRPDGARLGLIPLHDLTLTLDADLSDKISAGLSVKHVVGRLDDFGFSAMPDYTVVGAQAHYDLGGDTEAYLRVENLFDQAYETSAGYAAAPRAVFAGIRAAF